MVCVSHFLPFISKQVHFRTTISSKRLSHCIVEGPQGPRSYLGHNHVHFGVNFTHLHVYLPFSNLLQNILLKCAYLCKAHL